MSEKSDTPRDSLSHENDDDAKPPSTRAPSSLEGESEAARIERLGRQRPERLGTFWREIGFVFSIIMSQALVEYFVSGFTVLIPTLVTALEIPAASTTWPASAFSLVVSAFLLPFGRVADIYGGFPVYLAGFAWYAVWSLIGGFAQNELMLDFCRALQGLGPAAFLPAGLMLLGSVYRPGPRKNLVFSIYGAMAPMGFFVGIFFAGVAGQYAGWRWYFWIGTILAAITTVLAYFTIPNDMPEHRDNGVKMDWWGSVSTIAGIILVVFAITDASHAPQGWATPYIIVTLVLGVVILGIAFYVEGWVAEQPLLPFEMFKIKYVRPFILGLLFAYGPVGIYVLYATLYSENILNAQPLQLVAWYAPMAVGGLVLATLGGLVLHLVSAQILMFLTGIAIMIDSLLFAVAPVDVNYWRWIFPAMICATLAIDLIFNVANIFFSTTLPARQQGLAGSLSNALVQLSVALWLGFADVVATETSKQGLRQSYKNVFWLEFACGAAALLVFMFFVRIKRAKSDLTADEKEAQRREAAASDIDVR